MSEEPDSITGPSSQVLLQWVNAGHLERVIQEGNRFLSQDADDFGAHLALLRANAELERFREGRIHLDYLLDVAPQDPAVLSAVVFYYRMKKEWKTLISFAKQGLEVDPNHAGFHFQLGVAYDAIMSMRPARHHARRARELAPDDAGIAQFDIALSNARKASVGAGLQELSEYEEALALDPLNPYLHNSIGTLYLRQLENPHKAELSFREALRTEPEDREFRENLFQSIAEQDLVYRVFSMPSRAWREVVRGVTRFKEQPFLIVLAIFGFKFVLIYFGWLLLITVLFWPGCKVYEYLLVSEIPNRKRNSFKRLRIWSRWQGVSKKLRFLLFLAANLALWLGLLMWMGISWKSGFKFIAIFGLIHFVGLWLMSMLTKVQVWIAERRLETKRLKAAGNK